MKEVDDILEAVRRHQSVVHLGKKGSAAESVRLLFDSVQTHIARELEELGRLSVLSRMASAAGFVLIVLGVVSYLFVGKQVGTLASVVGLLSEIMPVLFFRRVDASRRELRALVPDHRLLFAALVLVDTKDPAERARLIDGLTTPSASPPTSLVSPVNPSKASTRSRRGGRGIGLSPAPMSAQESVDSASLPAEAIEQL